MTEPDVALTDYGLTVECAAFALLLYRTREGDDATRRHFAAFFAALAAASLAGGTVHGFFLDGATAGNRILWPATLLAIGGAALAAWRAGAGLVLPPGAARAVAAAAALVYAAYAMVVLFVSQEFRVAIIHYLPAAVFLLGVFGVAYARTRERPALVGAAGMLLTFAASGVQMAKIGLHPRYFNHNALYHVIQAGALYLVYRGARWLVGRAGQVRRQP